MLRSINLLASILMELHATTVLFFLLKRKKEEEVKLGYIFDNLISLQILHF